MKRFIGIICIVLLAAAIQSFGATSIRATQPPGDMVSINKVLPNGINAPVILPGTYEYVSQCENALVLKPENQLPRVRVVSLPFDKARDKLRQSKGTLNIYYTSNRILHPRELYGCDSARDWVIIPTA